MTAITGVRVFDERFPTSLSLDGSDAMNKDGDYSAAYVVLDTDDPELSGFGFTFTIGRGNDLCVEAARQRALPLIGRSVDEVVGDLGGTRAEHGLQKLIRQGQPITFRGLAKTADVSLDFLYSTTDIRIRVEQLRAQQRTTTPAVARPAGPDEPSSVVRTLTAQMTELKRRHRDEVQQLQQALEAAHGENLELRRRLGPRRPAAPDALQNKETAT